MKTNVLDKLLKRKWTPELIEKYLGQFQSCLLTYASDEEIRQNAASGGTITGLLIHLLESGEIDGALVCTTRVEGNEVKADYKIATSRAQLIEAQGSKYIETHFPHDAIPMIKEFTGKLALVLLPCDTWIVNRLRQTHPDINKKIRLTVTLFCGHVSDPGLTRLVVRKNKLAGVSLTSFRYRVGHWRGNMRFSFEDTTLLEKAFNIFSDYQNLYFFCARKCLQCHDHTGYDCDVSVGDVWLMSMKNNPIKHNAVIVRSKRAEADFQAANKAGKIQIQSVPAELIADAQSRSLFIHYNVSARAKAGKLLGLTLSDQVHQRVRLIDFIIAFIILFNYQWTSTLRGRLFIGRVPKPLLKFYLYVLKGLEIL